MLLNDDGTPRFKIGMFVTSCREPDKLYKVEAIHPCTLDLTLEASRYEGKVALWSFKNKVHCYGERAIMFSEYKGKVEDGEPWRTE